MTAIFDILLRRKNVRRNAEDSPADFRAKQETETKNRRQEQQSVRGEQTGQK